MNCEGIQAPSRYVHTFRADSGIQKGYLQADRIVRRLKSGETVSLYDKGGRPIGRLVPQELELIVGVVVTRDDFGALATNLKLLLEKDPEGAYPWVVNIIDLGNLAEAWKYLWL